MSEFGLKQALSIPGYDILLPDTRGTSDQARILLYAKFSISCKLMKQPQYVNSLPTITVEVKKGKEKATIVNFTYREYTGGVSGLGDLDSQKDRLQRVLRWWTALSHRRGDFLIMGDINLDYKQ